MVDITAQREAESAAESATDRLRELVEHGPAILYGYSVVGDPPTANTDYVSPQFAELLGVPAAALADDPGRWFAMVHPDDRVTTIDRSKRAWATGMSWDNEYRMLHASGEIVWVWDRGRCVRHTDDGRPHRFVGSVVDITARRTAADELSRRLEAIDALEHGAPVVFWTEVINTATGSARYTYISAGSLEMMGYTPEELLVERHHFPRLVHPDDLDRVEALDQVAERTGSWDATYRIVHRDGGIRWIRSIGRKGTDTGPEPEDAVWHGVALDVTAQMEATGEAEAAPVAEVAPPI